MEKRTLKFHCLINMARFSKEVSAGYLMNTNNFTLTGRFSDNDIHTAVGSYEAQLIDTSEKIYTYEAI